MCERDRSASVQWAKFLEHWGCLLTALLVFLAARIFMFFVNLTGVAWMCFLGLGYVLMASGAGLIGYAKWPT